MAKHERASREIRMKMLLCLSVCLLAFATLLAAADVRVFKLATGEYLVHPFEGGLPKTAESKWMVCENAGITVSPEAQQYRLN